MNDLGVGRVGRYSRVESRTQRKASFVLMKENFIDAPIDLIRRR